MSASPSAAHGESWRDSLQVIPDQQRQGEDANRGNKAEGE